MKFYNNPVWVSKTPILTLALLESANIAQLVHMWAERSVEGQSLLGWVCVNLALILWLNFYRVITPNEKIAIYSTRFGVAVNAMVIATVLYFRYLA